MTVRLDVVLDKKDLKRVRRAFAAKPAQVDRAAVRAVRKTMSWGVTRIARGLAQRSQLPVRLIKGGKGHRKAVRIRTNKPARGKPHGSIWVGVRPVKAIYVGKPRQLKKGVRVGRHRFDGAFLATMKSGHTGIFKRTTRKRLPIIEQVVPLTGAADEVARVGAHLGQRLLKTFADELRYEVFIKGARRRG